MTCTRAFLGLGLVTCAKGDIAWQWGLDHARPRPLMPRCTCHPGPLNSLDARRSPAPLLPHTNTNSAAFHPPRSFAPLPRLPLSAPANRASRFHDHGHPESQVLRYVRGGRRCWRRSKVHAAELHPHPYTAYVSAPLCLAARTVLSRRAVAHARPCRSFCSPTNRARLTSTHHRAQWS